MTVSNATSFWAMTDGLRLWLCSTDRSWSLIKKDWLEEILQASRASEKTPKILFKLKIKQASEYSHRSNPKAGFERFQEKQKTWSGAYYHSRSIEKSGAWWNSLWKGMSPERTGNSLLFLLYGALPLDSCRLRKIISEPGIGEMNSSSWQLAKQTLLILALKTNERLNV